MQAGGAMDNSTVLVENLTKMYRSKKRPIVNFFDRLSRSNLKEML